MQVCECVQGAQHRGSVAYQARASPVRPQALHREETLKVGGLLPIIISVIIDRLIYSSSCVKNLRINARVIMISFW